MAKRQTRKKTNAKENKEKSAWRYFNLIIFGIVATLIAVVLHYNTSYWLDFLGVTYKNLSVGHKMLMRLGQAGAVMLALCLIVFRKFIYKKRKEFALLAVGLVIGFAVLESGLRVYVCNFADAEMQSRVLTYGQCGYKSIYSPHPYMDYYGTPNYASPDGLNMHNSMGFRGPEIAVPKPADVYRIAVLGGSTAYEVKVNDWRKDFARQLEKELQKKYNHSKIEVINAGLGGWSSWENLVDLEFRVIDIEPDMIILYLGTNDVHARLVNPADYKADNSGWRKQWKAEPIPLILNSVLVRMFARINPSGLGQFVENPDAKFDNKDAGFIEKLNGTAMETLQKNKPIYFERNIRNMIAIAEEYDVKVLLATWAYSNQFEDYAAMPFYESGFAETNEAIKKVGAMCGVPVYDYAAQMPMDRKYWGDGRHVNELGAKLKGALFANYIYTNRLMDKRMDELKTTYVDDGG